MFSHLPTADVRTIVVHAGDILFRRNDPTIGIYRVLEGCVTLQRTTEAGNTVTLHRATSGTLFAEASLFSDGYHCDAVCTAEGEVQHISKTAMLNGLSTDANFSSAFTALLARQVQSYRVLLEIIAIKSAEERILAAVSAGYLEGAITEFATRIHLTHETCYRALRTLCNEGRLTKTGRSKYQLIVQRFPKVNNKI